MGLEITPCHSCLTRDAASSDSLFLCRERVVAEEAAKVQAGGAVELPSAEFTVHSITVWLTPLGDSSCKEWSRVADIPLQP